MSLAQVAIVSAKPGTGKSRRAARLLYGSHTAWVQLAAARDALLGPRQELA